LLQGKSPLKASSKDKRGWGSLSGSYSAAEGYKSMMVVPSIPPRANSMEIYLVFSFFPQN